MSKKLTGYLRAYRRRWGLSQRELAFLLGWKSAAPISRIENQKRTPTLKQAVALRIIFGTSAADVFPGLFNEVEAAVMVRVQKLYKRLQGKPSRKTRTKLELLQEAIERARQRVAKSKL